MANYSIMSKHLMPSHWQWLLPEQILTLSLPEETRATCSQCPSSLNGYEHTARCCTYRPQLSNFLIGAALQDQAISKKKFQQLFSKGAFLPLASLTTPQAMISMTESNDQVCHYWQEGAGCTIHKFRNHTCSTFFCFTLAGPDHTLWSDLAEYVMMLENNISWWLITQTGFESANFLRKLSIIDQNSKAQATWNSKDLNYIWGEWYGKESQFFEKCAAIVKNNQKNLHKIALTYKENTTFEFQKLLESYPKYPENTHLPASKDDILKCEKRILSSIKKLYQFQEISDKKIIFTQNTSLHEPSHLSFLQKTYPHAKQFLILKDTQGEPLDFQPLTNDESSFLKEILKTGYMAQRVPEHFSSLIGGLNLRGFLEAT
ncbi:MAG: hypothetical protein AB8C84_05550 [Oligoflexales bacterium]